VCTLFFIFYLFVFCLYLLYCEINSYIFSRHADEKIKANVPTEDQKIYMLFNAFLPLCRSGLERPVFDRSTVKRAEPVTVKSLLALSLSVQNLHCESENAPLCYEHNFGK